jgi:hypothetical protein
MTLYVDISQPPFNAVGDGRDCSAEFTAFSTWAKAQVEDILLYLPAGTWNPNGVPFCYGITCGIVVQGAGIASTRLIGVCRLARRRGMHCAVVRAAERDRKFIAYLAGLVEGGVVFAHLLNVPVLAIAHHPKVATLMDDFELSKYCLDIRNLDVDLLTSTFDRLVANMEEIKACVPRKVACYQRELALQFDHLFPSTLTSIGAHHKGGIETNGRL